MRQHSTSNSQRKLAAKILKCGVNRVWMDPSAAPRIKKAITRSDIRGMIDDGIIKKLPVKKRKRIVYRKQRTGSRKGRKGAREGKKTDWLKMVRPQRKLLLEYKKDGKLKPLAYRKVYRKIKGGGFRSRAHLKTYLKENNLLIEKGE
ncbi:MAG: 50S ribosomal protein L19e [Candidatus Aenigmatarchaeota archaeon]